ncbi:MAG: hypothetical protein QNK37_16065 [Acidobacteriota bacterium]|nr:hypothetical protein [Acidobacteriota bacterium]
MKIVRFQGEDMRKITIVGAGQGELQSDPGLQAAGYEVTLSPRGRP